VASANATIERLGGPGQWLLSLPVSGVGGLQVLVRSIIAGTEPVGLDRLELGPALASFSAGRRYAAVVPTQLYRWASTGELSALAQFDAVLVGGAAVNPELLATATAAGVRIVRTYGMTETCGGCVYDGVPLPGVELRIDDGGQVMVRGPMLFDGYAGQSPHDQESWFATADRGEISSDGTLRILGRLDDVVVSGGVNVPLAPVERAIRGMPGVGDVAIVGAQDPEWGERVVAVVVAAGDADVTLDDIRDRVEAAGLSRAWAPRQLLVVPEFPVGATGKVDRARLSELAQEP
jgi:O-succinylbenzoic acid--CoA ligase